MRVLPLARLPLKDGVRQPARRLSRGCAGRHVKAHDPKIHTVELSVNLLFVFGERLVKALLVRA